MKWLALLTPLLLTAATAATAHAQSPAGEPSPSDLQLQANPELYLYMKALERYEDPKMSRRRRAEAKASERRGRLASQKWYGFSPLRPIASPVPWMGTYSPSWVGNGWVPFDWIGPDYNPTAVIRVESVTR